MQERAFGRTGRTVSELGVGMWGMGGGIGGWTGADDRQSLAVLQAAVDAGVTFFDSALVYGAGHSDELLGQLARANPGRDLRHTLVDRRLYLPRAGSPTRRSGARRGRRCPRRSASRPNSSSPARC